MRKFRFEKLVRDKIPDSMIANGQEPKIKVLNDEEYIEALKKKVLEEAQEIPLDDGDSLAEKIADVEEIIEALLKATGIDKAEVLGIRNKKNEERGAFDKRLYIESVGAPDESKWLEYYLKFPQKYPEIK